MRRLFFGLLFLLPALGQAQPVTTVSGESKQLCRMWDGTDVALVDGSGNQMVAGTLTCNAGTGTFTVSGTVGATQSGTWTMQPGNTANTTAWLVTGTGGTFPITAASLPLPSGASTSAKQPSLGTAGAASSDVLTVQGIASMTPLKTDGSATTQPVSGPLTDAQLRATALPVSGTVTASGPLTDTQLRATAVPVSGPLTDTQLRATAVPISGTVTASGPLTDTQLRATAVPVSGTVTATDGSGPLTVDGTVAATQSGTWGARVTGNAGGAFDAANNATAPANLIVDGFEVATQTSTQPAAATAGNVRRGVARTDGVQYVALGGPVQWSCGLAAVGTTLTQCQAAPGASLRLYITDILAQSSTTTGGLFTVRFGTGTNCGTSTGNLFFASASALISAPANTVQPTILQFSTPVPVTANNAICVLGVATNTTNIQVNGYTAP